MYQRLMNGRISGGLQLLSGTMVAGDCLTNPLSFQFLNKLLSACYAANVNKFEQQRASTTGAKGPQGTGHPGKVQPAGLAKKVFGTGARVCGGGGWGGQENWE